MSHGVRSTERLIFFHPFSFLPPVPMVGPSVSLSPSVSVEKVAACVLFIFLPAFRPFSAPIVHPKSRPSKPLVFFSWVPVPSPASRACTRPFFCRIFSVLSFVAVLRGAGATRWSRGTRTDGGREAQSAPELRRAQSRAANEVAIQRFTILPQVPSDWRNG